MTVADIADPGLADQGVLRPRLGLARDAHAARDQRALQRRTAAGGGALQRLPARHGGDGQPDADAEGGRGQRPALRQQPSSTQDDVAAALVARHGIPVFAIRGEDDATYYRHIDAALDHAPHVTMDDGADLVARLHTSRRELLPGVLGGTEETTTGVIRLRALAESGGSPTRSSPSTTPRRSTSSTTATEPGRARSTV